jgi:hypothetical protein
MLTEPWRALFSKNPHSQKGFLPVHHLKLVLSKGSFSFRSSQLPKSQFPFFQWRCSLSVLDASARLWNRFHQCTLFVWRFPLSVQGFLAELSGSMSADCWYFTVFLYQVVKLRMYLRNFFNAGRLFPVVVGF